MKQSLMVNLSVEKDGNTFTFVMPVGAKWGSAYDAAFEVLNKIMEMSKEAAEKMDPKSLEQANDSTNAN